MLRSLLHLLLVALVATSFGCSSTKARDGGRSMSISYVGDLRGEVLGDNRITIRGFDLDDENEKERIVTLLSEEGDPGLKYAAAEVVAATYDRLLDLGMEDLLRPGPLPRGAEGFEIDDGAVVSHFRKSDSAHLSSVMDWVTMIQDFMGIYNSTISLKAVGADEALDALREGKRVAGGGR